MEEVLADVTLLDEDVADVEADAKSDALRSA
jgi:hypothetical protein